MVLTILNGVSDKEIHEKIEYFSFLCGISTEELQDFDPENIKTENMYILAYFDAGGLLSIRKEIVYLLQIHCPLIVVTTQERDLDDYPLHIRCFCSNLHYPFSYNVFCTNLEHYIDERLWANRVKVYGRLRIDKGNRQVRLGNEIVNLKGYDYEIFLLLVEHMGSVISREVINETLPRRTRHSYRNVDTHIKCIRKLFGTEDVIQCVRSVGYCISPEVFYEKGEAALN